MGSKNGLSLDRVYQASFALKDVARKTDLIYSPHFSNGNEVYLKTENLQVTGSFKLRGAYFKISKLNEEEKAAGIVACSAGNHAQGVAYAAQAAGEGEEHGVKADAAVDPDIPPGSEEADECHQRRKAGNGGQKEAACLFQHRSDPDSLACAGCRLLCRFPGGGGAGLFFVFFLTHG